MTYKLSPAMNPDPREAKLPRWASQTIDQLRRDLYETHRTLDADAESPVQARILRTTRPLDPHVEVAWRLTDSEHDEISVRRYDLNGMPTLRVMARQGALWICGSGGVNSATLRLDPEQMMGTIR